MIEKKSTVLYFHASADLYGSDYVLLELVKKAAHEFNVLVLLPTSGPLVDELRKHNIDVKIVELAVLRRELLSFSGMFGFVRRLILSTVQVYFIQRKYEVLAFHTNTSAVWTGCFAAWVLRRSHFWQVMEIIERPKIVSWAIGRIVGGFSQRVFCISDAVRNQFIIHNKGREDTFQRVYHGVDRSVYNVQTIDRDMIRRRLRLNNDNVLVGFAGRFNAWKGQDVFATAAKIILSKLKPHSKVHFLFLGSVFAEQHQYEVELKELLESSDELNNHSTVLGFQNDFQNWLGAMDILALPSKLPEPNATVTVAAMTLGIPVVGTNIGGTVEAVVDGETGFLVPPNDPDHLAEKILKLVNSQSLRSKYGLNAKERANTMFSIDNYTTTILKHYNKGL